MPGASVVVHAPSLVRVAASRVISRMRRNRGNQPNDQERFRNQEHASEWRCVPYAQ